MRSLTQNPVSSRVRSIRHGEETKSLWRAASASQRKYYGIHPAGRKILKDLDKNVSHYNEADAAEDVVLFPEELKTTSLRYSYKELTNPIADAQERRLTAAHTTVYRLPHIWLYAVETLNSSNITEDEAQLLQKMGLWEKDAGRISYAVLKARIQNPEGREEINVKALGDGKHLLPPDSRSTGPSIWNIADGFL